MFIKNLVFAMAQVSSSLIRTLTKTGVVLTDRKVVKAEEQRGSEELVPGKDCPELVSRTPCLEEFHKAFTGQRGSGTSVQKSFPEKYF